MKDKKQLKLNFIIIAFLAIFTGVVAFPGIFKFWPAAYDTLSGLKINLGLDLQGGLHLEYKTDLSGLDPDKTDDALQAAQDVIERRVNAFGVGEPVVQIATVGTGGEKRIIVELPGIKDFEEAKDKIKETPFLEFREEVAEDDETAQAVVEMFNTQSKKKADDIFALAIAGEDFATLAQEHSQDPGSATQGGDLGFVARGVLVPEFDEALFESGLDEGAVYPQVVETHFGWHIIKKEEVKGEGDEMEVSSSHILFLKYSIDDFPDFKFTPTGLTGKHLSSADVVFQTQGFSEPQVSLKFDSEGTALFAEITKNNIGKQVAIYLDGEMVSAPVVQAEITNGEAVITGNFSVDEALNLKKRLNEGALPVPITLISQQSIEASLGMKSLESSLKAGMWGLIVVMIFMIGYYRFFGLVASFALIIYALIMVSIFKLSGYLSPWPITLTLSGIAGFILSVGMAVDANILIFERIKEELRENRSLKGAIEVGFKRAWPSIRDGNFSTLITSAILIWVGTGFVKGFAIILALGILTSMFTAIFITKNLMQFSLLMGADKWLEKNSWIITK